MKQWLTRENIQAFPIKSKDMSVAEMRKLCVDFFRFSKMALWKTDRKFSFIRNASGTPDLMEKGAIYGGLPYVGLGSGNMYRLLDFLDEETGTVSMEDATAEGIRLFGNQCSIGAFWGWARVINSVQYDWTQNMIEANGFLKVGPYVYDGTKPFTPQNRTTDILEKNGEQVIFESYALMHPADGFVYYTTAGHVTMCASEPVVVRREDGTIDGDESYLYFIEQAQKWKTMTGPNGEEFTYKSNVDWKMTFKQLFDGHYIPFTFAEFLGKHPVEDTWCNTTIQGDTVSLFELCEASVRTNYSISDVYLTVTDEKGNVALEKAIRATMANMHEISFENAILLAPWKAVADGKHRLRITCQLGTGERPVVYEGTIAALA